MKNELVTLSVLFSAITVAIGLASLVAHVMGHGELTVWFGIEPPMALSTAITFIIAGVGMLCIAIRLKINNFNKRHA